LFQPHAVVSGRLDSSESSRDEVRRAETASLAEMETEA
jgi:hypothetical protein